MLIMIKSPPYQNENALGSLFIGLVAANHKIPTNIVFMGRGIECLYRDQQPIDGVTSISDTILQLVGLVKFYYIPNDERSLFTIPMIYGVKKRDYSWIIEQIREDSNILIL